MPATPRVSVVVPVYNIPNEYLKVCLNALASQTLPTLEIIVVDDGSPMPGNAELCDEFAAIYPQLKLV